MSLEFSRRSFMKLTALTAVAVAGSSLLSGCDSSSSTLYPSGAFGKELTLMGKFTVSDPKYDADAKTLTCAFKGTCTSDTPLAIRSKFFQVDVLRDKKTTSYNAESVGCTLALSQSNYYLQKKESIETTMTLTGIDLQNGDVVSVMYFPRLESSSNGNGQAYTDLHATWKGTYKDGSFT